MGPVAHESVMVPVGPNPMRERLGSEMDEETHSIPSPDQPLAKPAVRRMSQEDEKKRRESIKAILKDTSMSESERRLSIQLLMDGRRMSNGSTASTIDEGNEGSHKLPPPPVILLPSMFPGGDFKCIPVSNEQTKLAEKTRPECSHYDRKCTLIAPCCGASFGCRICHDDCPILPPKQVTPVSNRRLLMAKSKSASLPNVFSEMHSTPEDNHHTIDRFAIKEIICRECYTRQSSKT
jgi:hypothetical protein